jgi:hypothetical protein
MNVYLKPTPNWDWAVWVGEEQDYHDKPDLVTIFKPGPAGYYLDAYSFAKTKADLLGIGLLEVHQDR